MKKPVPTGAFNPKLTTTESKSEATTRVARSIVEGEVALREAKTERLRRARLAKEAAVGTPSLAKQLAARRRKA